MMRVLLCVPPATFSVAEMAWGYRDALRRAGHDVLEYSMWDHMAYHRRAATEAHERVAWRNASETILQQAIYHRADLVLFVCALSFHPIALELLEWGGFKTAVLHTESPYQDPQQIAWNAHGPSLHIFTHERTSAERYGWTYLPHAYDPQIHRPVEPDPAEACDVLFVGSGYKERIALLEAVDWTGIHLSLRGWWDKLSENSPLRPFCQHGAILNADLPRLYAGAKICLNPHRHHAEAVSFGPRTYELAACEAFQITDDRNDGTMFGRMLVRYRSPKDLEQKIRYYLANPDERSNNASIVRQLAADDTFDARAAALTAAVNQPFTKADYFEAFA